MKTIVEIREEIIEVNYYLMDAIRRDDKTSVMKYKILLNGLIKLYLKED